MQTVFLKYQVITTIENLKMKLLEYYFPEVLKLITTKQKST